MPDGTNHKQYDLEDRCLRFAKAVNKYVKSLPKTVASIENGKQLVRDAGSVGANYIEANEAVSRRDFIHRIRICKKEAKESQYWLRLTEPTDDNVQQRDQLIAEVIELMKIFGAILQRTK
jgi:four helix bundle protein